MFKSTTAYLGLGCNLGDRLESMRSALSEIRQLGDEFQQSFIYESEAWGYEDPNPYLNAVCSIRTELSPAALHEETLRIERLLGRTKKRKTGEDYSARKMDIDILFYGEEIIRSEGLKIPHPRLHLRNFVLRPLADLNPNLVHPILGRTIRDLNSSLKESSELKRIE